MSTRGSSDSSSEDPQRLGLREHLAETAPPEWMDHNIRAMAQEQARVNAQRGTPAGSPGAVRSVRRQWLPWAGSLAGLAVVVLMVTGQPEHVPQGTSEPQVSMAPAVPNAPAASNSSSVAAQSPSPAPNVATRPVIRGEAASLSDSSAPVASTQKPTPAAGAREQEKRTARDTALANKGETTAVTAPESVAPTTPAASTPAASPLTSSAPSLPPAAPRISEANQAVMPPVPAGSSAVPPPAAAGRAADSARMRKPEVATQSAEHDPRARQAPPAAMAKRTRDTPATTEACTKELEGDIRMDRIAQARELFRLCRERFPEHVWSEMVRDRLGEK